MTTPMRRQYLQIKKQYPDAIVFFRLGDFYETFDQDAEIVAAVCDIALTSRPIGKNQRVPLAGVPYHSADSYIARLVGAGHKVAIVEQVGGGLSSHLRSGMSRGGGEKSTCVPRPGSSTVRWRASLPPAQWSNLRCWTSVATAT